MKRELNMIGLKLAKNSPHILFAVGIVGVVAAAVWACHSTLKLEEVVDEAKNKLDAIEKAVGHPDYSEEDKLKDTVIVYSQTVVKMAQLYGPAILCGVAGITALTGSHRILTKRNAILTVAYASMDKSFAAYRKRVAEELGTEQEHKFNFEAGNIVESSAASSDSSIVRTYPGVPVSAGSVYARWFDPEASQWMDNPEYNHMFLRAQQQYANDLLRSRGHVFLNEVYDSLGLSRTKEGAVVGWVYDPSPDFTGDNYIDFGLNLHDMSWVNVADSRDGLWLDFNVDGLIFDRI